jgi:putative permease
MRQIVRSTAIVLATVGGLYLLFQFRVALLLFLLSLIVAAVVRPLVNILAARKLPRALAILLIYVLGLAAFAGLIFLIGRPLLEEISTASNNFVSTYGNIVATWPAGTPFQQAIAARLPPPQQLYAAMASEQGLQLLRGVFGVAQGFFSIVSQLVIILALSIYWSADRIHFERLWFSILPARQRVHALEIWRSIERGVAAYVRSELVQSLLAAILLIVAYQLIGIRYPILLGLAGALLWLIPWLGAVLALLLTLLVGMTNGLAIAILAAVITLVVLLVLEVVVEPRLFNRRRYSSLLIVVVLVAMADVYGIVGLIIAPPLAAALQILFGSILRLSAPVETVNPTVQVANLQTRLEKLRETVQNRAEPPPPEISSMIERLEGLIAESNKYFENDGESVPSLGLPVTADSNP